MSDTKYIGKKVIIYGEIVEYLVLGKREWFTVKLPNNQLSTLNKKLCEEVKSNGNSSTTA